MKRFTFKSVLYCAGHGVLPGLLVLSLSGCALDMRKQKVSDRIEMHAGTSWFLEDESVEEAKSASRCTLNGKPPPVDSDIPNSQAAMEKYLQNKDLSFTPNGISVGKDVEEIPLYLINQGLNCAPRPGPNAGAGWRCNDLPDEDVSIFEGSVLQRCYDQRPYGRLRKTNYMGLVGDRYCLFISVMEEKPGQDKWPTDINHDRLKIELSCVEPEGPGGSKIVIGGPRPNFRQPGPVIATGESTR